MSTLDLETYLANELARQIERAATDLRHAADDLDRRAREVRELAPARGNYAFYATQVVSHVTATLANLPLSNIVQGAADAAVARSEALTPKENNS